MFYATRTQATSPATQEQQALAFYTKSDRAAWIAANGGQAITAADNAKLKTAGAQHTNNGEGFVFFSRLVA